MLMGIARVHADYAFIVTAKCEQYLCVPQRSCIRLCCESLCSKGNSHDSKCISIAQNTCGGYTMLSTPNSSSHMATGPYLQQDQVCIHGSCSSDIHVVYSSVSADNMHVLLHRYVPLTKPHVLMSPQLLQEPDCALCCIQSKCATLMAKRSGQRHGKMGISERMQLQGVRFNLGRQSSTPRSFTAVAANSAFWRAAASPCASVANAPYDDPPAHTTAVSRQASAMCDQRRRGELAARLERPMSLGRRATGALWSLSTAEVLPHSGAIWRMLDPCSTPFSMSPVSPGSPAVALAESARSGLPDRYATLSGLLEPAMSLSASALGAAAWSGTATLARRFLRSRRAVVLDSRPTPVSSWGGLKPQSVWQYEPAQRAWCS